ncbi:MAG: protein-L-isoaspartate(D-aspartate) O-methyltransferase [Anaerolineae bacterium]
MGRVSWGLRQLFGLVLLAALLAACSAPPPLPTPTAASRGTVISPLGAQHLPDDVTVFPPTAVLPTPAVLDRNFDDPPEMQAARARLVGRFVAPRVEDARVVAALERVPRHSFIPTHLLEAAYNDHPLPIGFGQTISQPSLVAIMTELLELDPGDRVLEIGTGSGYQAAILRELTDEVYTVEIIPELAGIARAVLDRLGYADVHMDRRDGYYGWLEHAPYDAIIVTAAPDHLPSPLIEQLNPEGGRMVIPIGPVGNVQTLWLVVRDGDDVNMRRLMDVRFVPFTRETP